MSTVFIALANEIRKGLLISWHYRFNLFNEFLTLGINFIGMILLLNYGNTDLSTFGPSLLGYIVWAYSSYILEVSYTLTLEGRSGTLEHMYMSPVPPAVIFVGSTISTLISSTIMISLMSFIIALICNISIPFDSAGLPIFFLTLTGLLGFGLTIAGAALLYKNVGGFVYLISTALFYLNGSMLPIEKLPLWLQTIANTLPTTQGITILKKVVFEHISLASLWADGSLMGLLINTGIYLVSGLIIFKWCEQRAKKHGKLGLY